MECGVIAVMHLRKIAGDMNTWKERDGPGRRKYDSVWLRMAEAEKDLAVLMQKTEAAKSELKELQDISLRLSQKVQYNTEEGLRTKIALMKRLNKMMWGGLLVLLTLGGSIIGLMFEYIITKG